MVKRIETSSYSAITETIMSHTHKPGTWAVGAIRLAVSSVFLFAMILLPLGISPSLAQQRDTGGSLVGASSNNFPPVNILDRDGELTGFGRELSDAVLDAVGARATHIHSAQWTKVLEMLDSGDADFIHDTGFTVERTSFLDYTAPILEMPERIFVLDDRFDIDSFADLAGKRVACVDQHITHLYLKQFPEINCHIVKRPIEGLNALAEGEADAFIYPKQIGLYMALSIGMRGQVKMVGEPLRTLTWHMTVKKGNAPVVDLLNQGLAKVRADGTYDRIYAKWFAEPLLAGFSEREVAYLVGVAIVFSLLVAGTAFALFFALRIRRARDALAQSIDERERAEAELREREELYRVTFELAALGLVHVSPDGRILRVNQKLCDILGYERDELVGLTHGDVTVLDDKADDLEMVRKLLAGEISSSSREKRYYRKDGSIIWVNLTIALVRDDAGEPGYFISIIEEITVRKDLESRLRQSSDAINSASETITLFDADDRLVQINRGFASDHPDLKNVTSLGMTFEEIIRAVIATGAMSEADGREEEWLAERLEKHRNPSAPFEVALKGGGWILVSERRLPDGGTATITSDITRLKQAEEVVRINEQRLNAIIDQHRDAIIIVDDDGLIRFSNAAAERILGRKAEDLIDSPFGIPLVGGDIIEVEIAGRKIRIAEMQAVPFAWEGADALLVTLRDITERKQAENHTQQLRSQLAHSARLSTVGDLAAGLAHEINQPLTAINNYIQASVRMLRSDETRAAEVIGDLEKAGRQVLRAGDIVTFLRGAVKKDEGPKTDIDLVATIKEVANFLDAEIRARKAELSLEFPDSLPPIHGDKVQIQQVVLNLIQNSLEEAQSNTNIQHEITVRAWETMAGSVAIEISDNGPGVPSERHKDLFSAFYTTKTDGLGLGLSICKTIVERHGGRLWLVTEAEQGATFAFTLQTSYAAANSTAQMAHISD